MAVSSCATDAYECAASDSSNWRCAAEVAVPVTVLTLVRVSTITATVAMWQTSVQPQSARRLLGIFASVIAREKGTARCQNAASALRFAMQIVRQPATGPVGCAVGSYR
jgi:hypothetical protein